MVRRRCSDHDPLEPLHAAPQRRQMTRGDGTEVAPTPQTRAHAGRDDARARCRRCDPPLDPSSTSFSATTAANRRTAATSGDLRPRLPHLLAARKIRLTRLQQASHTTRAGRVPTMIPPVASRGARPSEVLVSSTVKDIVAGSGRDPLWPARLRGGQREGVVPQTRRGALRRAAYSSIVVGVAIGIVRAGVSELREIAGGSCGQSAGRACRSPRRTRRTPSRRSLGPGRRVPG